MVGAPCGHHGQYTFYKAIRLTGQSERIYAIGDFFFVRIWQDSELVSIGELQLLWTDRVSDQTLVSLRLYFLPENTPDGRSLHGERFLLSQKQLKKSYKASCPRGRIAHSSRREIDVERGGRLCLFVARSALSLALQALNGTPQSEVTPHTSCYFARAAGSIEL
ncbi:jg292 [Pararge aegeria aegeria]|uniref:Jg292 protein n=1 Tax=Pararge aegeria aegeria TaxID=348720 RepID=A0A8S4QTI1_9NEOP|nr:jg292 [Pararge aegeria aegeria]